jgi:hypothetical protein
MIRNDVTFNVILACTLRSVWLTRTSPAPWEPHLRARSIEAIVRIEEDLPGARNGVDIQGFATVMDRLATVWVSPPTRWTC